MATTVQLVHTLLVPVVIHTPILRDADRTSSTGLIVGNRQAHHAEVSVATTVRITLPALTVAVSTHAARSIAALGVSLP
eukprot:scaffold100286_cov51-Phaeocystis_antarctica.AAC.1